jgi:hypothetical protein
VCALKKLAPSVLLIAVLYNGSAFMCALLMGSALCALMEVMMYSNGSVCGNSIECACVLL